MLSAHWYFETGSPPHQLWTTLNTTPLQQQQAYSFMVQVFLCSNIQLWTERVRNGLLSNFQMSDWQAKFLRFFNPSPTKSQLFSTRKTHPILYPTYQCQTLLYSEKNLVPEYDRLEKVSLNKTVDASADITWSAHHASQRRSQGFKLSVVSLFLVLKDQAHSDASVKHAMNNISYTVAFLNPGWTTVKNMFHGDSGGNPKE